MRDHIGLGKLAGVVTNLAAAKASHDLVEERGVEIDLLIGRAVERSHGALRGSAATGVRRAAIEDEHRRAIDFAVLGEDLLPLQLGAAEHFAHEAPHIVLGAAGRACARNPRVELLGCFRSFTTVAGLDILGADPASVHEMRPLSIDGVSLDLPDRPSSADHRELGPRSFAQN